MYIYQYEGTIKIKITVPEIPKELKGMLSEERAKYFQDTLNKNLTDESYMQIFVADFTETTGYAKEWTDGQS